MHQAIAEDSNPWNYTTKINKLVTVSMVKVKFTHILPHYLVSLLFCGPGIYIKRCSIDI